jgi:aspartyl-tRNA synthetase
MKENMYRDIYCGEVNASHVGQTIKLAGWVNSIRNLGGLLFITLRDETGIVQLISEEVDKYININRESTITVTGVVQKRTDDMINSNMKTGEIEVSIKSLEVLGECENVLPFEISRSKESTEDTRLKYRYLDLRNSDVHNNILFRSQVIDYIRTTMKNMKTSKLIIATLREREESLLQLVLSMKIQILLTIQKLQNLRIIRKLLCGSY